MIRSEIIRSLSNAIRACRGLTYSLPGTPKDKIKWVRTPQPTQSARICELLGKLRFNESEQQILLKEIDGFKHVDDFKTWIKEIHETTTPPSLKKDHEQKS